MTMPIFISFYAGSRYYHDAADRLRADLDRLGIPHDIEKVVPPAERDWAGICRMKPAFISRKLEEHRASVFWLDVDSRVLKRPPTLEGLGSDFAAFLRDFYRLQEFDPALHGRTFVPGFLFFNYTDGGRRLAARAAELEASSTLRATDDYFLEEAWRRHEGHLGITLLSPAGVDIGKPNTAPVEDPWLQVGRSGNVGTFAIQVEQHGVPAVENRRLFAGLQTLARDEVAHGRLTEATVYLRRMIQLDPDHDGAVRMLARVLRRQGHVEDALEVFETRLAAVAEPRRQLDLLAGCFDLALDARRLKQAGQLLRRLEAVDDERATGLARNRAYRLSLVVEARRVNRPEDRVPLWWMEQPYPGNFGDVLNPWLVQRLTGVPPRLVAPGAGVLAIGSVIKFARAGTQVWGSGSPRLTDRLSAEATYRAVRGPLTRRLVLDSGGSCPEIYGDPALLLPRLYEPSVDKRHPLGLIRHYVHREEPLVVTPDVAEIDIRRCGDKDIEAFIDEVIACETIISTSLHGLIVAHAYGIPAVWAEFAGSDNRIQGNHIKFLDYFASIGITDVMPFDLSRIDQLTPALVRRHALIPRRMPDLDRLLEAAPFVVRIAPRTEIRLSAELGQSLA